MPANIVLITSHDLGKHLGCYGHETVRTPALDRLAQGGVRFDRSFCTAPHCSPSRAALATGRYPHATGMMGLAQPKADWRMHPDEVHLARRLADAGFDTALAGVQHLTDQEHVHDLGFHDVMPRGPAPVLGASAAAYLRDSRRHTRPFYLEVGFAQPHRPYAQGGALPDDSLGVEVPPYLPDCPEARQDVAALQGAIHALDTGVGIILQALEETGLARDTWVIFTPDHGLAMPRAKCTLYDPGIETALLMRWPAMGIGGGRAVPDLISNIDIVPTILDGIGLVTPDRVQGRSFWPLLRGERYEPRSEIFAEKTIHTYYEPMRCIRTQTHKLIVNCESSGGIDVPTDVRQSPIFPRVIHLLIGPHEYVELYDLTTDPLEQASVAGDPAYAEIERGLTHRLARWMRDTRDPILAGPIPSPYYERQRARLRSLAGLESV